MSDAFPRTRDQIDREWLSGVLGSRVTGYDIEVLEGSNLASACRLRSITYGGDRRGPSSVILKTAHPSREIRSIAVTGNFYTREVRFLTELASQAPIRTPEIYACESDGRAACEFFAIVMEDLSAHSTVFDQVDDPPDEAFARKIAREAAGLHAAFWESATTRLPWVARPDGRYLPPVHFISADVKDQWPVFRDLWRRIFGVDVFDPEGGDVEAVTALLCGSKSHGIHRRIYDVLSSRPKTLLHGDLRADNVFRSSAHTTVEDATLTYIDFHLVHAGPPGPELTEAWTHSLEPEVRRQERAMLREYHEVLVSRNPAAESYTYDMLLEDYKVNAQLIAASKRRWPSSVIR